MTRLVLDTNALLRFLLDDIHDQKVTVEKLLNQARADKVSLYVPQIVVFEINFTLTSHYHRKKEEIIDLLESITSAPFLDVESREIFDSALSLYRVTSISLVDCFLATVSKTTGAELFTFDKKLKKLS